MGEAEKAFAGYDRDDDGKLDESELNGRGGGRSAMGGFIRGHAKELDRDGDGVLTRKEVVDNATRMFSRLDRNGDGKATKAEQEAGRRPEGDAQRRGGSKKNGPRREQSSATSDADSSQPKALARNQVDEGSREDAKDGSHRVAVQFRFHSH